MGGGGGMMNSWAPAVQSKGKGNWGGDSWGGKGKSKGSVRNENRDCTVWIGGIPEGITQEELMQNFGGAGTCKEVRLTKGNTGLAIFATAEEATLAISMFNGSDVNGSI